MNSAVMKALTGLTTCKLNNEKDLKTKTPQSFTAIITGATKIYSLFPGKVLYLGFYKGMGTLTISVSNHEFVRYLNMNDIQVWNNATIRAGQYLGTAYAKTGLQFEYCTQWQGESKYPVRINNNLYFKQNPIDILEGKYVPQNEINISPGITRPNDVVKFTADQLLEWGDDTDDDTINFY